MAEQVLPVIVDTDDPKYIEERNNRKLTADKIRQILSKVLNDPSSSARRWVWELMQNAKDVPRSLFDHISVQIILSKNQLQFKHNGDPFTLSNIFSLIQQVSSKDSVNTDVEVTGKFGTGFIATHLLSEIIDVKGIVFHKGVYRNFELVLDRSGRTSEDLLPKIESALDRIRDIQNEAIFPSIINYANQRTEASYDTSFTYHLSSEEKRKSAVSGIEDLINTLPLTLVNLGKIKKVEVINNIDNSNEVYTISEIESKGQLAYYEVSIKKGQEAHTKYYIKTKSTNVALSFELGSLDAKKLITISKRTPYLFRDFPLIGSEKFFFPFVLNGLKFNPTEDRDGLLLHSAESAEAQENRTYVEEAFELAKVFVNDLIVENVKNRYIFANSRLPFEKWENTSKDWYVKLQRNYRNYLLDKPIVETEAGSIENLRDCVIPSYGITDETKINFYGIVLPFLGKSKVPLQTGVLEWINAIGPSDELELWGISLSYDLDRFLKELEKIGNLKELDKKIEQQITGINWLNSVYQFLIREHQIDYFQKLKIIPTINGDFKSLEVLYEEERSSVIPDEILDVLEKLEYKWRDEIIHRDIKLENQNINKRDLVKASHAISETLKKETKNPHGVYESDFMQRKDAFEILINLLSNVESLELLDNFRCKVYLKAKELFGFAQSFRKVSNLKDFGFDVALKHFVRCIHVKIQSVKTVDELAIQLKLDNDKAIIWLNSYLSLLQEKADFKMLLEYGNIFPNRVGILIAKDSIYGFGTKEIPLDDKLVEILKNLDVKKDWAQTLLHDGIDINLTPKKFEELGSTIDHTVRELEKEESQTPGTLDPFKQPIYDLIDWCNKNKDLAIKYLSHTVKRSNDLWVRFSMTPEIMLVLRDEKSIKLLTEISKANLSEVDQGRVINLINSIGELSEKGKQKLMHQASSIIEDEKDFEFKKQVGKKVEDSLKALFVSEFPNYEINYIGKGPYDYLIKNPSNGKSYSIELKSIKHDNYDDIRMAISQARHAHAYPENYALLVIRRPEGNTILTNEYLHANLKCVYQIGSNVKIPVENSYKIESIVASQESIKLSLEDPTMKVFIRQDYIKTLGKPFDSLKEKVHEVIK
jgi:hypothetical protein